MLVNFELLFLSGEHDLLSLDDFLQLASHVHVLQVVFLDSVLDPLRLHPPFIFEFLQSLLFFLFEKLDPCLELLYVSLLLLPELASL